VQAINRLLQTSEENQMEKVRWGLLSTANINRRVIPAIRQSARGELTAVASRSQESADSYAHHWDLPRTFASYEAMLASDAVDAVYISLPNQLHAEWTVRALQAGKHVLCEKPFALTLANVDRMIAAAQATGLVLAEAFMYRHHPQMKLVEAFVRDGRLGDIALVQSVFNFQLKSRDNIRLAPELGGGSLWDVGIYPVSFAQFVMGGPPEWVFGFQDVGDTGVDEFFAGQLHYGHGRVAQISSSFRTPYHTRSVVVGTKGRLRMSRPFTAVEESEMVFFPAEGEPEFVDIPDEPLYLGEIEDMHSAILDGRPTYLTLAETRNHIRTVLALYESAMVGQPVTL
jgi:predicted dehydrogenase